MFHSLLEAQLLSSAMSPAHFVPPSQIVLRIWIVFTQPMGWGSTPPHTSRPLYLQTNQRSGLSDRALCSAVTSHSETLGFLQPAPPSLRSIWYFVTILVSLVSRFRGCVVRATKEASPLVSSEEGRLFLRDGRGRIQTQTHWPEVRGSRFSGPETELRVCVLDGGRCQAVRRNSPPAGLFSPCPPALNVGVEQNQKTPEKNEQRTSIPLYPDDVISFSWARHDKDRPWPF